MISKKLASVNTAFWDDPYIEDLNAEEKLLFLYLVTNPKKNLAGITETTLKKVSYHTGIERNTVDNILNKLEKDQKILKAENYIILVNHVVHQNLNSNMKKGVMNLLSKLPEKVKHLIIEKTTEGLETLPNLLEPFETIPNPSESLGNGGLNMNMNKKENKNNEIESESERRFGVIWDLYPKKTSLMDSKIEWINLLPKDQERAIEFTEAFVNNHKTTGNFKYLPQLLNYLKKRRWEDGCLPYQGEQTGTAWDELTKKTA